MLAVERKSGHVARWLIAAIREGRYKVGEKLPPERTLAGMLNVSRTAVREALSVLQTMGIVEPRVGDGTYLVGIPPAEIGVDEALDALEESGTLYQVWQVRRELESILARLAAETASPKDLSLVHRALLDLETAVASGDPDEYLEANNRFHLAVAEAGKNPFLRRALLPLLEITKFQLARHVTSGYVSSHAAQLVEKHQEILNALRSGSPALVEEVLKRHFAKTDEVFLNR